MANINTKITNGTTVAQFQSHRVGTVFIYGGTPYMKCFGVMDTQNLQILYNAINLETGLHSRFEPTDEITCVINADLTLTI